MQNNDMNVIDFAREISMITSETQIADEFAKKHASKRDWWSCEREHLTVWCLYQPTNGVKGFYHEPNNSARRMYNNYGKPGTLLWLAEALGEDKDKLKEITEAIKDKNARTACAIIRKAENIPFDRIMALMSKQAEAC